MAKRVTNTTIHSECREIIARVIEICDKEKEDKCLHLPLMKASERASEYTGVGLTTIKAIRKENKKRNENSPNRKLKSPGKKRRVSRGNSVHVDSFDQCVIRNTILDFYMREKVVPTVLKLLPIIKGKINFPWGPKSLLRVMKSMGFKWKRCQSKRRVLIERPDIVDWRSRYIVQLKQFREENRDIIYVDETWVDNTLKFQKCWQSDDVCGVQVMGNATSRLIIVHAGGENGFLCDTCLIFRAGSTVGDYHGQMNGINFEKWVREKLLPHLPEHAVVVLDNAPYHSMEVNKTPSAYSRKADMIVWLQRKGVHCEESMRKTDLYRLIAPLKPRAKQYKIDELLAAHGHTVVRLPPYMCEMNPIELAWAKVKRIFRERNVTGDMSVTKLQENIETAIQEVTVQDWQGFCKHVEKIESDYWEKDGIVPDIIDEIIVNLDSDSGSSESEACRSSSDSE